MSTEPRVAFIGYGEVGRILGGDLRQRGVSVAVWDIKFDNAPGPAMRQQAQDAGLTCAASALEAVQGADLVVCAVTASQAVAVAQSCAAGLKPEAIFLDFNSASPGAKQRAAEPVHAAGARYVEGAVMTSVPPHRLRVPLLLGGPHAASALPLLQALGFKAEVASAQLGVASATKMCRSIMIKGLEAMVIECFTTARGYGVEDQVIASLVETYPGIDWEEQGAYLFQRVIEHGRRRSEEVREVAITVREAGLDSFSAAGTAQRQAQVADWADAGVFGARGDQAFARSADWRVEADRILAHLKAHRP